MNEDTRFDGGNDNRSGRPRFTPTAIRANTALVKEIRRFGQTHGLTMAQGSLAWLLARAYDLSDVPAPLYWLERAYDNATGWDFKHFTLDFNSPTASNVFENPRESDACFVRCVKR